MSQVFLAIVRTCQLLYLLLSLTEDSIWRKTLFPRVQGRLLLPLATDPCHAAHSWVFTVPDLKTGSKHLCWEHITKHLIQVGKILLHLLSFLALASGPLLYHTTKSFFLQYFLLLQSLFFLLPSKKIPQCVYVPWEPCQQFLPFPPLVYSELISSPAVAVYLLTIVQILQVTTLLVKHQPQGKETRNS